jgi:glycerol-3-phosphate acyltransferase PlsY
VDITWQALTAVAAILGHVFTIFLAFKGGNGVATGFGAFLALTPMSAGTTIIVFILTAALSRYISLASILATAAYPMWVVLYQEPAGILWPAMAGSAIIIAKHHQNIRRLISGTEHRIGRGSNAKNQ